MSVTLDTSRKGLNGKSDDAANHKVNIEYKGIEIYDYEEGSANYKTRIAKVDYLQSLKERRKSKKEIQNSISRKPREDTELRENIEEREDGNDSTVKEKQKPDIEEKESESEFANQDLHNTHSHIQNKNINEKVSTRNKDVNRDENNNTKLEEVAEEKEKDHSEYNEEYNEGGNLNSDIDRNKSLKSGEDSDSLAESRSEVHSHKSQKTNKSEVEQIKNHKEKDHSEYHENEEEFEEEERVEESLPVQKDEKSKEIANEGKGNEKIAENKKDEIVENKEKGFLIEDEKDLTKEEAEKVKKDQKGAALFIQQRFKMKKKLGEIMKNKEFPKRKLEEDMRDKEIEEENPLNDEEATKKQPENNKIREDPKPGVIEEDNKSESGYSDEKFEEEEVVFEKKEESSDVKVEKKVRPKAPSVKPQPHSSDEELPSWVADDNHSDDSFPQNKQINILHLPNIFFIYIPLLIFKYLM